MRLDPHGEIVRSGFLECEQEAGTGGRHRFVIQILPERRPVSDLHAIQQAALGPSGTQIEDANDAAHEQYPNGTASNEHAEENYQVAGVNGMGQPPVGTARDAGSWNSQIEARAIM